MPGKEIKGRSPIANYRDGGRTGFSKGRGAAKSKRKNGPVRPINLPWPDENDPVPPKRKRK